MAEKDTSPKTFPDGFIWATATASYQIEGGWNVDGKGESIWDRFCHDKGRIANGDTGDVACDSYNNYEKDIQLLKNLGCSHYRFSLSWARLLPDGMVDKVNEAGVSYYNKLIDGLLAAGIEPIVTLYHWDLPQALHERGGWIDEQSAEWFAEYAKFCFQRFGERVKWWVTLNEPSVVAELGYSTGIFAPGIKEPYTGAFKVTRNLVRAHVKAYRAYEPFKCTQNGRVGIAVTMDGAQPLDPSDETHKHAADLAMKIHPGIYLDPILGNGDFPCELLELSDKLRIDLNLPVSPLQSFTNAEKLENKGTCDFIGVNNYTSRLYSMGACGGGDKDALEFNDIFGIKTHTDPNWKCAGAPWLYEVPEGLRRILNWLMQTYKNQCPLFIMENGTSDGETSLLSDQHRVDFLTAYIKEVLKAIEEDGINVIGYTVWSLMDNFEWADGYTQNFGLHQVDFTDPTRPRIPKLSAKFYQDLIKQNGLVHSSKE